MQPTTARLRALIATAILLVTLVGARSLSAAEAAAAPTAAAPTVAGSGVLVARGDGHVRIGGRYVLTGSVVGGTLRIDGAGVVSSVTATGWIARSRLADGCVIYRFADSTGTS